MGSLRWTWNENKNRINRRKHGLKFETATLVFEDPLMAQTPDSDEDRWLTIGAIGNVVVIVAHTWPRPQPGTDTMVGRIISERAESHGA